MKTWLLLLGLLPTATAGQTRELVVEAGASRFLPPVGVEGPATRYLMAGLRGSWLDLWGSGVEASLLGGRSADRETGGDFISGEVAGSVQAALHGPLRATGEIRALGFTVSDPVPYRAAALEGEVALALRAGMWGASLAGLGGLGGSRVELRRTVDGPAVSVEDRLWRYGLRGDVLAGGGAVAAGLGASYQRSAGGDYRSIGARVLVATGARGAVELRADLWKTPVGRETTGGVALVIPFGRVSLRGFLGRSQPDPLTLAEPGRGGGGALVGFRLAGGASVLSEGRRPGVYREIRAADGSTRVRFRVRLPDARSVELLGDFNLWVPLPMTLTGDYWEVELPVAPGTYHFGFYVDGEWYLPEDAPDAVPDEWGRRNATLVVEG